jgi:hypothetical protein
MASWTSDDGVNVLPKGEELDRALAENQSVRHTNGEHYLSRRDDCPNCNAAVEAMTPKLFRDRRGTR